MRVCSYFVIMIIISHFCAGCANNPDVAGQVISGILMGIGSGLSGL